jgi:hypothetical protein
MPPACAGDHDNGTRIAAAPAAARIKFRIEFMDLSLQQNESMI